MQFLIVAVALIACVAAQTPGAPSAAEITQTVNELEKGLEKVNVTLTEADKEKLKGGIERVANFDINEHPEMKHALDKIKDKVPILKEKVCKIAHKADAKAGPVSAKIGVGIEKGFTKLGNEKFPQAADKFITLVEGVTNKANRADLAAKVKAQLNIARQCMAKHLTALAGPLGHIIGAAGAHSKNTFKTLVKPFVDDVEDCESETRRR